MKHSFALLVLFSQLVLGHYAVLWRPLANLNLNELHNQLRVDEAHLQEKSFLGEIDGERAVSLALDSFLNDSTHPESPLAIAGSSENLLNHLNRFSSEIRFNSEVEEPEHGEGVQQNWIIQLKIPSLSDHIFWAVIERNGSVHPYNYGFN